MLKPIEQADIVLLLLPCGNDAHADWAYGVGLGKTNYVIGSPRKGERSPVHLWADDIYDSAFDYLDTLKWRRGI